MRNADRRDDRPTLAEMIGQVVDLSAGLGILVLPLLVTALPGVILMLVLPAVLLLVVAAIPLALAAALLAPFLLVRRRRRR
jgi:Flp pilus assembly protein TadB